MKIEVESVVSELETVFVEESINFILNKFGYVSPEIILSVMADFITKGRKEQNE